MSKVYCQLNQVDKAIQALEHSRLQEDSPEVNETLGLLHLR